MFLVFIFNFRLSFHLFCYVIVIFSIIIHLFFSLSDFGISTYFQTYAISFLPKQND